MSALSRFIRHDLMCTDVAEGTRFYSELFGWKATEVKVGAFHVVRLTAGEQVLGGQVHVPPTDIPGVGRFAVLMDSTGAPFAVLRANR